MYINTSAQALNRYESNFRKNFSLVSQPSFQNQSVATHCLYLWMRSRENPSKRVSLSTRKVGHFCEIMMGWMYRTNKRMSLCIYMHTSKEYACVLLCIYTYIHIHIKTFMYSNTHCSVNMIKACDIKIGLFLSLPVDPATLNQEVANSHTPIAQHRIFSFCSPHCIYCSWILLFEISHWLVRKNPWIHHRYIITHVPGRRPM